MFNIREKIGNAFHGGDPAMDNNLNISRLKEVTKEASLVYEDMYVSDSAYVQFMAIGTNGAFIIIPVNGDDHKGWLKEAAEIREYFKLNKQNSFVFLYSDYDGYFLAEDKPELLTPELTGGSAEDVFYDAFTNLYNNLFRAYVNTAFMGFTGVKEMFRVPERPEILNGSKDMDGRVFTCGGEEFVLDADDTNITDGQESSYVRDVLSYDEESGGIIDEIADKCEKLEHNGRPIGNTKEVNGQEYVLKPRDVSIGREGSRFSLHTGLSADKTWYPVSDEDPDRYLLLAAIGGCFGAHKFVTGRIGEGLLYLLTCGCMGILPMVDIFMLIRGSAFYYVDDYEAEGRMGMKRIRQKFYIRRPTNIPLATVLMFLPLGLGILLSNTLYVWILKAIGGAFAASTKSVDEQTLTETYEKVNSTGIVERFMQFVDR